MKNKKTISKILKYIGKYKLLLPVSIIFALITVAATLIIPILFGEVISSIEAIEDFRSLQLDAKKAFNLALAEQMQTSIDGEISRIVKIIIWTVALIGTAALAQWLMSIINNRIAYSVSRDIRKDAFVKIESLPLSYLDSHPHGDILSRTISDTEQICDGLVLGFTQLITGVMTIVGTMVLLFIISWPVAIVVLVLTPMSLFLARFIAKSTFRLFKAQAGAKGKSTALVDEMIGNQKLVQALGYEDTAVRRFDDANSNLGKTSLKAIFFSSLVNPSTRFINNIIYAVVALVSSLGIIGTLGALGRGIDVGILTVLLAYVNQYTKPFNEISGVITEFQNSLAGAARVFELIEQNSEIPDAINATEINNANGEVKLDNVCFSYSADKKLIDGISLDVTHGQRVAIVGPTGCGKTTLINLLMRFYDVRSGEISVDGHPITTLTRKSLRKSYGMVLQDTWLKAGTIKENISFGKPQASDEEIIAAAKAAHAHSFIKRLPEGYDTVIAEDGGDLSQGQKQLLCIARVMLALPPMLILDEATSSIDTRTEMKIQEAFGKMMTGRTSFIVAHRLSTIKEADLILVMRNGNVIEQGRHDELIERGGFYSELYNSQFAHV